MTDTPDKEPTDPVLTNHDSEEKHQKTSPVLPAKIQIPHSITNCYKSEKKRKNRFEWGKLCVEILTLLAVMFYASIAYYQWGAMREATDAAKKSAEAAVSAVQVAKETLKINKEGTEANLKQSQSALQASIEMARRDQRAWIGPMEVTPAWKDATNNPIFIKEGAPAVFSVVVGNSGKSPALKVRSRIKFVLLLANRAFAPNYEKLQSQSVVVMQPQEKFIMRTAPSPRAITASDINIIRNGEAILYLFGDITYEDIFKIPHSTTFCMLLAPTLDSFIGHSTYTDAN